MTVLMFASGFFIGYGIRLVYFLWTGHDVPLCKPDPEIERLKEELRYRESLSQKEVADE